MVNDRFPQGPRYGFERVDAPGAAFLPRKPASIENLRRIKSVEFFANFQLINLNANTCDLSTAVSQGIDCAPSSATAAKNRNGCEVSQRN
jgi:hypothetical protein